MPCAIRKTSVAVGLFLVLSFMLAVAPCVKVVEAEHRTIVVPDNYSSIQEAVDRAGDGDTVFVRSGFYYNETVIIDKPLSLIGEDKTKTHIIGDWGLNGTVVLVRHDDVTVQNLTLSSVRNAGTSGRGVHLLHVRNCCVSNCNFVGNGVGVWLYGSSENTIEGNQIDESTIYGAGIKLQNSQRNSIFRNNITENDYGFGIVLDASTGNILDGNQVTNNYYGIWVSSSSNNSITGNTVMLTHNIFVTDTSHAKIGSYGIELQSSSDNRIAGNAVLDTSTGIRIISLSCSNIVENNTIDNSTYYGLQLADEANSNVIRVNVVVANSYGLAVKHSSNNTVAANNITDNLVGANFEYSSNNFVYHNNFIDNKIPAQVTSNDTDGVQFFDDGYPSGGNYWDDYSGTDANNDGIGDTPYVIDEHNHDNYPLMNPVDITTIPEFPSWIIFPLFLTVILVVAVYRKKLHKTSIQQSY